MSVYDDACQKFWSRIIFARVDDRILSKFLAFTPNVLLKSHCHSPVNHHSHQVCSSLEVTYNLAWEITISSK